jgi:hypothetical protein
MFAFNSNRFLDASLRGRIYYVIESFFNVNEYDNVMILKRLANALNDSFKKENFLFNTWLTKTII